MILLHHPGSHPQGTGPVPQFSLTELPPRPYTYRGTDYAAPTEAVPSFTRRPPRRPLSPFIDPGGPSLPLTAPPDWHCDMAGRDQ
jgi:hypothetical protein